MIPEHPNSKIQVPNQDIEEGSRQFLSESSPTGQNATPVSKPPAAQCKPALHPAQDVTSPWKVASEDVVSNVISGPLATESKLLLILVSFLASYAFSSDILSHGAAPRKRWTEQGEIGEMDASDVGLVADLEIFLSDDSRLTGAVDELQRSLVLSRISNDMYALDETIRASVLATLSTELSLFWRQQALTVIYRSVPWKYLEAASSKRREFLLPHLKHTVLAVRDLDGFENMPNFMRSDLALALLEASRFPKMEWKRFTITCAKEVMHGVEDPCIHYCIAERESLLNRIAGNQEEAVHVIDNAYNVSGAQKQRQFDMNNRMYATIGHMAIQRALNYFQNEQLAAAMKALDTWQPLHYTPAEQVVLFQIDVLRGRVFRCQGRFQESLTCLSRHAATQCGALLFDEDMPDLVCELADTLRELDDPLRAEQLLRTQLESKFQARSSSQWLLKLSLAESLFAQERFLEAEELCLDVLSRQTLLKMGRLRLHITLAKLRHIESDWESAVQQWTKALTVLQKFPPTSGLATLTVHLSICDAFHHQGQHELELDSHSNVATLEELSQNSEAKHWIAGLRHWEVFLKSRDTCIRGASSSN